MSEEEEEVLKKEDRGRGGQGLEYEIYGGKGGQMADPEHPGGETQEQFFLSLSRSSTLSFENLEKAFEEASSSKAEKTFKPQAIQSKLESFKDVESIWFNKDVWVIPPADTDDEVLGSSLVDDVDDDDDDDEGVWGQHPSSVRASSDYLQSRIRLRAKMEIDFMLVVKNLLQEEGISTGEEGDPNSWLQIVSNLALHAANYVKPNTSKGGGMDPGEYVKVKCVASGRCADSTLVKGIVCHKNVQNRRMTSRFRNPRLLLLGGALEYQRSHSQLSSLSGLPQQENDYLTATVARIETLHPNVLLVEKAVAGIAQETLLSKGVSLVLKVKRPLLDRLSRCTGANVVSSADNFEAAKVGQCEQFRIEKFEEELNVGGGPGSAKKNAKYLMFFEGCPRPLGCTIILQGASTEELKRLKKAVQLTVSYAYHLSLETSYLADEGAILSSKALQCIPSSKRSSLDSIITTVPGFTPPPSRAPSHGRSNSHAEDGISRRGSSSNLDTQQFTEFAEEDFPPSTPDHQSIVFSVSSRTMSKGNVCEKPHLKRIKYYGLSDRPVGNFLKEFLGNTTNRCARCEEPMEDHEHRYVHSRGCLTLYSKVMRGFALPGEKEGKIWMWHRCLRCPRTDAIPPSTRRVPLSDAAQNISFGKLLQLNFSEQAVQTITGCGHYVYRDCLRFFGIGNTVACLMYSPIKLLCVSVPPPQLEFNIPSSQAWLKAEAQDIVELGVNLFAAETDQLRGLGDKVAGLGPLSSSKALEARDQLAELEKLLQKEKEDFEEQLQVAAPLKDGVLQPIADILALNKLRRHLALVYNNWDSRVKKLYLNLSQMQNTATTFIPGSFSEALTGTASVSGEPSSGGPMMDSVPLDSESGAGLPDSVVDVLDQLSLDNPPTALEETMSDALGAISEGPGSTAEPAVEASDTPSHAIAAEGAVRDKNLGEGEGGGSDGSMNKSLALERQISNPLPIPSTTASVPSDTDAAPRSRPLSEGDFPIAVDLPLTIETAWRGDGGSLDASVVEAPVAAAPKGEETEVSDLTAMTTSTSQQQDEGGEAGASTGEEADLDSKNTSISPVENVTDADLAASIEKLNEFSPRRGTSPLQEVGLAVDSRPSSPLKDKDGVDLEVSRPSSPLEEVALVSRPTSPLKDKEESEEAAGVSAASSAFNKGSRSPSRVLQSASSVYASAYSRSNSTVPKVQQFFLQGVARVRLPSGVNGTVIAVYEDEPTSVVAYAITSHEYQNQLQDPVQESTGTDVASPATDVGAATADIMEEGLRSTTPPLERPGTPRGTKGEGLIGKALTSPVPLTVKVRFTDYNNIAKTEYQVLCYYTRQFIALRHKCCGGETQYIRSLSRCKVWGAQGGKSKAYFAKTLDDRFILKQVSSTEKYSFLEFAPQYFKHLWETMSSGSPTCLAKILGLYTVTVRKGGKEKELDMMVMENLVYGKTISRMYDLKGSLRSRYNPDGTGTLLDQNLLEDMPTSPIFMTNQSKLLLERAVYNDTSFLAKVHVMDYSLLAVVLEDRQELVIGIIDYIRQYTWDKHLETWVKASGILGGSKNTSPTVVSPKEYKKRFRKAISSYFVVVPESEAPPLLLSVVNPSLPPSSESESASLLSDDNSQQ